MMDLKVLIKTPKGYAKSTEGKLRPFLLGRAKMHKVLTNKEDNKILWIIACKGNDWTRIVKNVGLYAYMVKGLLQNRLVQGMAKLTKDQQKELDDMLYKQTTVDIVKEKELPEIMQEFE